MRRGTVVLVLLLALAGTASGQEPDKRPAPSPSTIPDHPVMPLVPTGALSSSGIRTPSDSPSRRGTGRVARDSGVRCGGVIAERL